MLNIFVEAKKMGHVKEVSFSLLSRFLFVNSNNNGCVVTVIDTKDTTKSKAIRGEQTKMSFFDPSFHNNHQKD